MSEPQRQWNSTLRRGKGLNRAGKKGLNRKGKPKKPIEEQQHVHTGPPPKVNFNKSEESINHRLFQEAAWDQRVCAVSGKKGAWHPHHVIYEQHLRDRNLPIFDTRNSLRLNPHVHWSHHKGFRRVKTKELKDKNIEYAFLVLGAYAQDYLRRYYDDTDPDPRIIAHEQQYERAA